ncbi:hypothetical protein B0A53_05189 [Rhodotorula sp. CCFEE 5036]|nr:hypothetical protein B0A53_05189 [Rhodotorula sp. CCFEE 5036]
MLLSSTLHKLRIVNLPRHDPIPSSSPTTAALDSVRITSIACQTGPGGRCHSPQMRKLRSAPGRRGYSDLEGVAGGPSQHGEVAIDTVQTLFDLVPVHGVGEHAVEGQPIPSDRPFGSETESVASTAAAASLSSPPRSPLSVHAPAMTLTISTGFDTSGHRILTSRRRQSAPPSPTKCRKIKTAFGVGDEDDSASLYSSSTTRSRTTLPPLSAQSDPHSSFFATTSPAFGDLPPDHSDSPSSPPHHFDPVFRTETSHSLQISKHPREHLPIKTFTPPPPLVATSPPRLSTLSVLTRSSTLSSSSTTTSSTTLSRSNSRLQSFARRRSTLKRFSLPNNTLSLPPLSPTITSEGSPLERRFSSHVDTTTTTGLERHASCGGSSSGTCPSSPGFPPTPTEGSPLLPSPTSYFSSSADPSPFISSPELDLGSPPYGKAIRVSFELPSANASLKATAAAGTETIPERSTPRNKSRVRSLSEGATTESASWTASPPIACFAEEELHLTVTNPDPKSASRPASSASTHPFHPLPFESSSAPERRNLLSSPPTPHLQAASPPPPPLLIPSHEIGIAC